MARSTAVTRDAFRPGTGLGQWDRLVRLHRSQDAERCIGLEGLPAAQGLIEDHAHRVQVTLGRRQLSRHPLGRQIGGGAHDHPGPGQVQTLGALGDAEVTDLGPAVSGEEHVAGFDVPVQDSSPVRCLQRPQDLDPDAPDRFGIEGSRCDLVGQCASGKQLHDQEGNAVMLAAVEDLDHAGMTKAGGGAGLGLKALPDPAI
jgi:hypothetical protein